MGVGCQLSKRGLQKAGHNQRGKPGFEAPRVSGGGCLAFKLSCAFKLKQSGQGRQDR